VTFTLNARGKVDEMKLPDLQISFKRGPIRRTRLRGVKLSEADLSKFAGKYEAKVPRSKSASNGRGLLKRSCPGNR